MAAAIHQGVKAHTGVFAANIERAQSLGAVYLVGGEAQKVDSHSFNIDGDLAHGLNGVGVKQDATGFADRSDGGQGLNGANFVVCGHHTNKDGFVGDRLGNLLGTHMAIFVNRKVGNFKTVPFEPFARVKDRLVFDAGGDNVVAFFPIHRGHAFDGEVVAFGGSAGKDNFLARGAN